MNNEILLRKACIEDFEAIVTMFKNAVEVMDSNGIYQWDSIYPSEDIIRKDLLSNQMYLGTMNNRIVSSFVLNQDYDKEYSNGNWRYKDASFYVIHRLCVNSAFQGMGVGSRTMQLIENLLRNKQIETIRLDAFSLNPIALKMYEKLGYNRVGEVNWRKGLFYLFEKKI